MSSVRVAVRVRPFNGREKDMNAVVALKMEGTQTIIVHPETKEPKTFNFDFSYWSHDGFSEGPNGELIALNDRYATQRMVYNDVGSDVLQSAFDGYNATLFAYGQTGAGKSFSMVGYGVNKGIVPIVCEEMFKHIVREKDSGSTNKYQVTVTMLEIYNECIKDLLNLSVNVPGGLKVRSKPGIGVYVENLTPVAVASYDEIEGKMEEGTANRTVASTKMNATSSRAHTVFGINFTTLKEEMGVVSETTSRMNLVDLAGSERADSTGATGDRLKEGCAINASLSALGNVITALADIAMGKKKVFVPYRNSALTRLLQDALGGNSRTIMIAALSPADVNYDETLGTLRYADRCKKIKNNVVKMENATDKIIRMLKEENARLMALLDGKGISIPVAAGEGGEGGGGGGGGGDSDAIRAQIEAEHSEKLKKQMEENERIMTEMKKSWEEKLKDAAALSASNHSDTGAVSRSAAFASKKPYMINLHEDPQLSECVVYVFKEGESRIGRKGAPVNQDIILGGLNILAEHALVSSDGTEVFIEGLNRSKTFVNGDIVNKKTELHTGDRLILGNNFVFRFVNPDEESENPLVPAHEAWQQAQDEFNTKQGLRLQQSLGGELGNLEKEEAAKRKELEDKLAQMEAAMLREREEAKAMLNKQKELLLAKGGNLTDEEKAQLDSIEQQYSKKNQSLEDELATKKKMSEKMLQEQMKRKRYTKKVEEQLAKLIPVINEANSMSEELGKGVKFEAKLSVSNSGVSVTALDETKNLKQIEVNIRVTSKDNGNIWNWNTQKFDNRLFMMREVYQEFLDFGPRELSKSKDPFWDPPEAIEIGKAYVYLKALSQLVEIESDFAIVDFKGEEQGTLEVDVYPEGPNGEDLDYLDGSEELIGQTVVLIIRIPQAKGISAQFNNDVYVTFNFNGQSYETEPCATKTTDPKWKFEARVKLENITEEIRQYLLKDAAVFEIRGFTDKALEEVKREPAESIKPASMAAPQVGIDALCQQCEEQPASINCLDCPKKLCDGCFSVLHKSAKKAGHKTEALGHVAKLTDKNKCFQCEEKVATVNCVECEKKLCPDCNAVLHKSAKKANHTRESMKAPCEQCDENQSTVTCTDCTKNLCDNCNALLHKAASKATHNRVPVA